MYYFLKYFWYQTPPRAFTKYHVLTITWMAGKWWQVGKKVLLGIQFQYVLCTLAWHFDLSKCPASVPSLLAWYMYTCIHGMRLDRFPASLEKQVGWWNWLAFSLKTYLATHLAINKRQVSLLLSSTGRRTTPTRRGWRSWLTRLNISPRTILTRDTLW